MFIWENVKQCTNFVIYGCLWKRCVILQIASQCFGYRDFHHFFKVRMVFYRMYCILSRAAAEYSKNQHLVGKLLLSNFLRRWKIHIWFSVCFALVRKDLKSTMPITSTKNWNIQKIQMKSTISCEVADKQRSRLLIWLRNVKR